MLRQPSLGYTPIGLVDDDPKTRNLRVHGVRVLGTTDDLPAILHDQRPDEVLIAIPSAPGSVRAKVVEMARRESIPVKTLPGLHELISGDVDLAVQIRPVQVEDVLGREPVDVDLESIASYLEDETVLVTGAGGSIGSELCRQIARLGAARLVLVENSEARAVRDRARARRRAELPGLRGRPRRRRQPAQAARGVRALPAGGRLPRGGVQARRPARGEPDRVGAQQLARDPHASPTSPSSSRRSASSSISTDKAANPKNLMGQSKALCEWIVESYGHRADVPTRFVAVRFGNVLGSSGSVIPIFRRQIERGGPVTVRHPEMTRYFMTIPEAVSLVVQAGSIGGRGDIFVLDMGEPVRILDLARNMIELSGLEPDRDVAIEFTGALPGEKLHEELWSTDETIHATKHPKILRSTRPPIDAGWLEEELAELQRLVADGETLELVSKLGAMVKEPRRVSAAVAQESAQTRHE